MSQADSLPWGTGVPVRRTGDGTHRLVDTERVLRALPWMGGSLAFAAAALLLGLRGGGAALFAVVGLLVLRPTEQQQSRLDRRATEGLPALVGRTAVATMVMVGLHAVALGRFDWWLGAPVDWALAGVVAAGLVVPVRGALRLVVHALRRRGVGIEPALVVGAGPVGVAVAQVLRRRPEFGVRPVGFVDEFTDVPIDLPVVGGPRDLPELVTRTGVRRVIVAFGGSREHELVEMLRATAHIQGDVRLNVLPRFYELGVSMGDETDDLWGYPLMAMRRPGPGPAARHLKRAVDVVGGAVLLAALAPVMAVLALLVRLSSPGPILFRQHRVGKDGQVFELLKFRSMRVADEEPGWVPDDDMVTPLGRFMRPTHLDELPQLFNVLRGDMALVGPRPERPVYADEFSRELAGYDERHRMPVGLTGWAQINGLWGDTSIADRARFDNRYIEDWSVWRDLAILLRTIPSMFGTQADEDEDEDAAPDATAVADDQERATVAREAGPVAGTDSHPHRVVRPVKSIGRAEQTVPGRHRG